MWNVSQSYLEREGLTTNSPYDAGDQAQLCRALEREDRNNRKSNADVEIGANRLMPKSPNGTRWSITVPDAGVMSAVAL